MLIVAERASVNPVITSEMPVTFARRLMREAILRGIYFSARSRTRSRRKATKARPIDASRIWAQRREWRRFDANDPCRLGAKALLLLSVKRSLPFMTDGGRNRVLHGDL